MIKKIVTPVQADEDNEQEYVNQVISSSKESPAVLELEDLDNTSDASVLPGQNMDTQVISQKLERLRQAAERGSSRNSSGMIQSSRPLSARGGFYNNSSNSIASNNSSNEAFFSKPSTPRTNTKSSMQSLKISDFEDEEEIIVKPVKQEKQVNQELIFQSNSPVRSQPITPAVFRNQPQQEIVEEETSKLSDDDIKKLIQQQQEGGFKILSPLADIASLALKKSLMVDITDKKTF